MNGQADLIQKSFSQEAIDLSGQAKFRQGLPP